MKSLNQKFFAGLTLALLATSLSAIADSDKAPVRARGGGDVVKGSCTDSNCRPGTWFRASINSDESKCTPYTAVTNQNGTTFIKESDPQSSTSSNQIVVCKDHVWPATSQSQQAADEAQRKIDRDECRIEQSPTSESAVGAFRLVCEN